MDEPSIEEYKTLKGATSLWMKMYSVIIEILLSLTSTGEPTIHPEFCDFLETIYNLGIVPNYTTNGLVFGNDKYPWKKILEYTNKYVGGVAVSDKYYNSTIDRACINVVLHFDKYGNTNINIHYIIDDIKSVDNFVKIYNEYKNTVLYFVLLPFMPSGRSSNKYSQEAFEYLLEQDIDFKQVAF